MDDGKLDVKGFLKAALEKATPLKTYDVVALSAICVDKRLECDDAHLDAHGVAKGLSNPVHPDTVGRLIDGKSHAAYPGSPGINVVAGVSLRGGTAGLIGRIGDDDHGNFISQRMKSHGVDYTPTLSSTSTTVVLAMITPDGERTFAFAPGAGGELSPADVDENLLKKAKITYLDSYLWLSPSGKDAVHHAAHVAKGSGGQVAMALNDAKLVEAHQPAFSALVTSHADILVGDRREFAALFKTETIEETLSAMCATGLTGAMTMGAKGAYVFKNGACTLVPAEKIEKSLIVDTNGAGDQFAAGFIYGLAKGMTALEAAQQGSKWASDVIQHHGAEPQVGKNAAPKTPRNQPPVP
jgi:sugar/nucleoside kinase (ribokinase family)